MARASRPTPSGRKPARAPAQASRRSGAAGGKSKAKAAPRRAAPKPKAKAKAAPRGAPPKRMAKPKPKAAPRAGAAPKRPKSTGPAQRKRATAGARSAPRRRASADSRLRRAASGDRPYIVALLVLVVLLGGMAAGPLQSFIAAADRVDTLTASRDQLRAEVDRLEERQVRLQDPEEIEILARQEQNLVKPGEVPYVVVTPEPEFARPEPGKAMPAGTGADESAWRRLLDAVGGLFD